MKEIKFRQPIIQKGKFQGWHYWGYLEKDNLGRFTAPLSSNNGEIQKSYQYTDQRDATGKEICAGDIVTIQKGGTPYEVKWLGGMYRINDSAALINYTVSKNTIEIIGTIYETPELVEQKKLVTAPIDLPRPPR